MMDANITFIGQSERLNQLFGDLKEHKRVIGEIAGQRRAGLSFE